MQNMLQKENNKNEEKLINLAQKNKQLKAQMEKLKETFNKLAEKENQQPPAPPYQPFYQPPFPR